MSWDRGASASEPHMHIALRVEPAGLRVGWRLTGVRVEAGEVFARLTLSITGAPTIESRDPVARRYRAIR